MNSSQLWRSPGDIYELISTIVAVVFYFSDDF